MCGVKDRKRSMVRTMCGVQPKDGKRSMVRTMCGVQLKYRKKIHLCEQCVKFSLKIEKDPC